MAQNNFLNIVPAILFPVVYLKRLEPVLALHMQRVLS